MGTTSSGDSMRSSAGCRYNAGVCLYSAHTGTIEGPLVYIKYDHMLILTVASMFCLKKPWVQIPTTS